MSAKGSDDVGDRRNAPEREQRGPKEDGKHKRARSERMKWAHTLLQPASRDAELFGMLRKDRRQSG
jgi:hypothetical protein